MRILVCLWFLLAALGGTARAQDVPQVQASESFADQFRDFSAPAEPAALATAAVVSTSLLPAHHRTRGHAAQAAAADEAPASGRERRTASREPAVQASANAAGEAPATAKVVRIVLILSLMAFLPALLISMTSFVRIAVVLSMIRHAFGMPETPPNQVLVSLALFLTAFSMMPTLEAVNTQALQPFLAGHLDVQQAIDRGSAPARTFMLRQVRDQDIKAVYDISHTALPARAEDVVLMRLVPAFMLNELRVAFRIGFVVLLPFLLIDLVVSSVLLALGMMMVPPSTISLPLKVLMFVLIDGWSLVLQGVVGSIH